MCFRLPMCMCGVCGSEAARCISLWDWVGKGEVWGGEAGGLEGAGDVGEMDLGGKSVVVIRTECQVIVPNATQLTHAMQKQCYRERESRGPMLKDRKREKRSQ